MTAVLIALFAKSAVVAGFALAMTALLRRSTAADRADILRAAVLVLLVLAPVALFGPDLAVRVLDPAPVLQSVAPQTIQTTLPLSRTTVSAEIVLPPPWVWAVAVWGSGAVLILGRFGLGLATLAHWSRRGRRVDQADWRAALHRLAPARQPRLRVSPAVAAPLSWGLSPGRILIGPGQLQRPDQAEAVLAHELAHIRRADWLFLALSRVAIALFWFNPLVWLAVRELERLSEQAVDETVVRHIDRETYARTLVGLAAQITTPDPHGAAVGMTGPARSLADRIKTVMSDRTPAPSRPWIVGGAIVALAALATPIAALELAARAQDETAAASTATTTASADADDRRTHRTVITRDGKSTEYVVTPNQAYVVQADGVRRSMTDEERRDIAQARAEAHESATQARIQRERARAMADEARVMADRARIEARAAYAQARTAEHIHTIDHAAIREQAAQARAAAIEARGQAARAQIDARRAREQAVHAMAAARMEMARGADEMVSGAREMRQEAQRLRDPAYRAQQIEIQRARGHDVTDQQLLDAIPKILNGADRMEQGAARMRESSSARD
ncbi:MAG: M56 family metallopeptidase [Caulobacterales bacterium]|nr:M56 family metallopeptidase [Caulobacterales bacterium]